MLRYFARAGACAIRTETGGLHAGMPIHVRGHTTDFVARVTRIELDHARIARAETDRVVAIQVPERVRPGDVIYHMAASPNA